MPNVVGKVTAEEASYLFRSRILPIEEPTGGEVVGISTDLELLVGSEMLFRIVLYVLEAVEDVLGAVVLLQSQIPPVLFLLLDITPGGYPRFM